MSDEPTYIFEAKIVHIRKWNPNYQQDKLCQCGHTYDRHFDSYADMQPIGCKYCECYVFMERKEDEKSM